MTKVRRINFVADEWLGGTLELKPYDRGIYITICALIYSRGEAVGIELIRRHCGVHMSALKAALARLSKAGKIDVDATCVSQKRCVDELCNTRLRMEKWAENLPHSKKNKAVDAPPARARARKESLSILKDSPNGEPLSAPDGALRAPARARKRRLSPVEGIFQGFADALAARNGGTDRPPALALLDDAGAGSVTPLDSRRLA